MRLLKKTKDGGPESPVDGYFLIEIKSLFSIALLKFNKGCRETYHNHAFNAFTWFLKGDMVEENLNAEVRKYRYSLIPKITKRDHVHRVRAFRDSWCITLRGPWIDTWKEYNEETDKTTTLTHGRVVL